MHVVHVSREHDEAFRRHLVRVAPVSIRPKIRDALANGPKDGGRAHCERYFGAELPAIATRAAALADWLDREFEARLKLPGLIRWLDATGFGSDYRLVKAFDAWAQMGRAAEPRKTLQ